MQKFNFSKTAGPDHGSIFILRMFSRESDKLFEKNAKTSDLFLVRSHKS